MTPLYDKQFFEQWAPTWKVVSHESRYVEFVNGNTFAWLMYVFQVCTVWKKLPFLDLEVVGGNIK